MILVSSKDGRNEKEGSHQEETAFWGVEDADGERSEGNTVNMYDDVLFCTPQSHRLIITICELFS